MKIKINKQSSMGTLKNTIQQKAFKKNMETTKNLQEIESQRILKKIKISPA